LTPFVYGGVNQLMIYKHGQKYTLTDKYADMYTRVSRSFECVLMNLEDEHLEHECVFK